MKGNIFPHLFSVFLAKIATIAVTALPSTFIFLKVYGKDNLQDVLEKSPIFPDATEPGSCLHALEVAKAKPLHR